MDNPHPTDDWKTYVDVRLTAEREFLRSYSEGHRHEHELVALALAKAEETMALRLEGHSHEHGLSALALSKAEAIMDVRLESMNEFRRQLDRQGETFATREMLKPFQSFMDKFMGTVVAFTIGNIILTLAISFVLHLWH